LPADVQQRAGCDEVDLSGVDKSDGITAHVKGVAGLPYETIEALQGVKQLDRLDKDHALC